MLELPHKIKNGTALWPSDSTSGYLPEDSQNTYSKKYMQLYVHCSIIYNSQAMEITQMPTNIQVYKNTVVHLYSWILFGHKRMKSYILQHHGWT